MKKTTFAIVTALIIVALALSATACSSSGGFWKLSKIDVDDVTRIELVNSGGAIKVLEGEKLSRFMDDLGKLEVTRDDDAYPDDSYDYCVRIYLSGSDGYLRYYLGQELVKIDVKSGAKESFYVFSDYEKARDLVSAYFYAE